MKVLFAFTLVCALGLSVAQFDCFGEGRPKIPKTRQVAKGADDFAFKMFTDIAVKFSRNSIVLSPYSVWSVLKLAYYGSSGVTETQLQSALGVASKSDAFYGGQVIDTRLKLDEGTTFDKADRAYFDRTMALRQCAIDKITDIDKINFKKPQIAADKINGDVSTATKGKIANFLSPSVLNGARFILLNAVYFKGSWTTPFNKDNTRPGDFYDEARENVISSATMMTTSAKLRYVNSSLIQASVLELPYEKSDIAMFLILPNLGTTTNAVMRKLSSDVLDAITNDFKIKTVTVRMPRFKMTTRIATELKDALRNLGVTDLFNPAKSDLSNFIEGEPVFVSESLHHATIEVTEEGTVAAAVTALIGTRSGAAQVVNFVADRPFLFLIRDVKQGITLFMGVLRDPNHTIPF